MKNKILIIVLTVVVLATAFTAKIGAQGSRPGADRGSRTSVVPERRYDIREVAIMKSNNSTEALFVGDNIQRAIQVLGQPSSVIDQYFEIQETTAKVYNYGLNKLYFVRGKLDSWELADNSMTVGQLNGKTFKVGDKLTKTEISGRSTRVSYQRTFLEFTRGYPKARWGASRPTTEERGTSFGAWLKNGNIFFDASISLFFDENDSLIKINFNQY